MSNLAINKPSTQYIKQALANFSISCPDSINLQVYQGDLTNDSRSISSDENTGDIFCAIIGHAQDGRLYIQNAVNAGAKLILSECENKAEHGTISYLEVQRHTTSSIDSVNEKIAVISFYQLNKSLYSLASAYYQSPEKNMTMIGITGTNGKTSTSQLLGQLLTCCQKPCAIIGTNGAGMVDNLRPLENTTPSATELMQLFASFNQKTNDEKVTHLAMEVSSHALEQGRVAGSTFDIAVYTNLSRDHLDYHGTMADYAAAKRKLFIHNNKQISVLNGDDTQARFWLNEWPDAEKENVWLYGYSNLVRQHSHFVSCENISHHGNGVDFTLITHLGNIDVRSPLLGDFNIDNLLAVIAVLLIENISLEVIAAKITGIKAISGRMEAFSSNSKVANKSATAVVDYAHTPDALAKALIACRQHCHGNLFVVFGCGGDRDKGKRPLMAQAAQKYADTLIITNDNPRSEKPMSIINDILAGLTEPSQASVIVDREQAVLTTLAKAQPNDVVLLAGKGHEDYIVIGHEKMDYNERQVVKVFFDHDDVNLLAGETL